MKLKSIFYFLAICALISCQEKQDVELTPAQAVLGFYEMETSIKNDEYVLTHSLELKAGGFITGKGLIQKKGENIDLGYNYFFTGSFLLNEDILTVFHESYFQIGDIQKFFDEKNRLVLVQTSTKGSEFLVNANFSELQFICPPDAVCLEESPFIKVK